MGSLWVYDGGYKFGWRLVRVRVCLSCVWVKFGGSMGVLVVVRIFSDGNWFDGWW